MSCITAETGTLVFAVFNMVSVTLSTALGFGLLIFWMVYFIDPNLHYENRLLVEAASSLVLIIILLAVSLISLVFAALLLNGILKKKPEHIKAYFVFGLVKLIFPLTIVILIATSSNRVDMEAFVYVLLSYSFAAMIYGSILYMINHTYKKYEVEQSLFCHKPLAPLA